MVAIIIPTINRSELLIRQLTYYADLGCDHTIYVGDSSTGDHAERTQNAVKQLDGRVGIVYERLPEATDYQAIHQLLQRVQEPYVALAGDDDFLVPGSLEKCAGFLDAHPEYGSAHGNAIMFSLGSEGGYGELVNSGYYPQGPVEQTSARLRLIELMGGYWPLCFSVQRVELYGKAAALASELRDTNFPELISSCLPVIGGKAKELDCLYLLRQHHYRRYGIFLPDSYDWVTSPEWLSSYHVFRDQLAQEIALQDGISVDEAQEVVKLALWSYLANQLATSSHGRGGGTNPPPPSFLRRVARAIPGVPQAWQLLRSFNANGDGRFTLPALMRSSSPYHDDFMSVYRAVTTPSYMLDH